MKIIYNNFIPFKGFIAINIYGVLFVRHEKKGKICGTTYVHEAIHTAQMKDFCPWLPIGGTLFYVAYFLEWLFRLITPPWPTAYRDISFEREAIAMQNKGYDYLKTRKRFQQFRRRS